jgi:hypothetical protein
VPWSPSKAVLCLAGCVYALMQGRQTLTALVFLSWVGDMKVGYKKANTHDNSGGVLWSVGWKKEKKIIRLQSHLELSSHQNYKQLSNIYRLKARGEMRDMAKQDGHNEVCCGVE